MICTDRRARDTETIPSWENVTSMAELGVPHFIIVRVLNLTDRTVTSLPASGRRTLPMSRRRSPKGHTTRIALWCDRDQLAVAPCSRVQRLESVLHSYGPSQNTDTSSNVTEADATALWLVIGRPT
jgi:hypothetical protein